MSENVGREDDPDEGDDPGLSILVDDLIGSDLTLGRLNVGGLKLCRELLDDLALGIVKLGRLKLRELTLGRPIPGDLGVLTLGELKLGRLNFGWLNFGWLKLGPLTLGRLGALTLGRLGALKLGRLTLGAFKLGRLTLGPRDEDDRARPAALTADRKLDDRPDDDPPFPFLSAAARSAGTATRPSTMATTTNRRTAMPSNAPLLNTDTAFSFIFR